MNGTPASSGSVSKHKANALVAELPAYRLRRQSAMSVLPVCRANSHAAPRQMMQSPRPARRIEITYRLVERVFVTLDLAGPTRGLGPSQRFHPSGWQRGLQ